MCRQNLRRADRNRWNLRIREREREREGCKKTSNEKLWGWVKRFVKKTKVNKLEEANKKRNEKKKKWMNSDRVG